MPACASAQLEATLHRVAMAHPDLILTVTGGLFAALVLGFGMHRVGLSPIVGYLLAGVVVGPSTPGYVANEAIASELAWAASRFTTSGSATRASTVKMSSTTSQPMAVRPTGVCSWP